MPLVDTHCHLDDEQFADRQAEVIARAAEVGVTTLLAVGTNLQSSRNCQALATSYSSVYAAVGIHPNYCHEAGPEDWEQIVELARQPRVVALGETGLDRHWDYAPFPLQQDYFDRHIRLSQSTGLPFIVHMRDCEEDVLAMLRKARQRGPLRGVMHSFSGSAEMAAECLSLGMYISFAGMVTYKKSDELRRIAASIPEDRLLVETDSPYLSPHPHRSQRPNEPALLIHTARCLAEARSVSLEVISQQTTDNAFALFSFHRT